MPIKHAKLIPRGVSAIAILRELRRVARPIKQATALMPSGVSARTVLHEPSLVAVLMKNATLMLEACLRARCYTSGGEAPCR